MLGRAPMDFDDYLAILRRRWLWITIPALAGVVIAYSVSLKLPERYISQTLVLIEQQRVPEGYVKPVVTEDVSARLASMREQILSRTRLQPLIERFGLYDRDRVPMEQKLDVMRKAIDIKLIRPEVSASRGGLPGFYISYSTDNARIAQQVCGEITSLFVSENLKAREQSAAGTTAFLAKQLEDAKVSLDEQDARLAVFQRKYIGQLPGQEQASYNMLATLNTQLDAATQALTRLEQDKTYTESMLAQETTAYKQGLSATTPVRSAEDQTHDISLLEEKLITLRNKYTDDHPDVIKAKRDLEALKAKRDSDRQAHQASASMQPEAPAEPEPATIKQLRAQLHGIEQALSAKRTEQQRIQQQISLYQRRIELSPTVQEEHKKLTRDYQTALQFYNELLTKKNQSEMATDLERRQQGEQFRVVDPPNLPERPAFPNRPLFAAGGLAAGLLIGLSIIALVEWRDRSVRTERDVELWLKLPTFGVIPEFVPETAGTKDATTKAKPTNGRRRNANAGPPAPPAKPLTNADKTSGAPAHV